MTDRGQATQAALRRPDDRAGLVVEWIEHLERHGLTEVDLQRAKHEARTAAPDLLLDQVGSQPPPADVHDLLRTPGHGTGVGREPDVLEGAGWRDGSRVAPPPPAPPPRPGSPARRHGLQ